MIALYGMYGYLMLYNVIYMVLYRRLVLDSSWADQVQHSWSTSPSLLPFDAHSKDK
jgi:hypothetical protein